MRLGDIEIVIVDRASVKQNLLSDFAIEVQLSEILKDGRAVSVDVPKSYSYRKLWSAVCSRDDEAIRKENAELIKKGRLSLERLIDCQFTYDNLDGTVCTMGDIEGLESQPTFETVIKHFHKHLPTEKLVLFHQDRTPIRNIFAQADHDLSEMRFILSSNFSGADDEKKLAQVAAWMKLDIPLRDRCAWRPKEKYFHTIRAAFPAGATKTTN